jgi:RimJ/RimL family protein N-acetyltransferase
MIAHCSAFAGSSCRHEGSPIEGEYEVGWRLREDAWGLGYAKEAAIASLDHAFGPLGAERVVRSPTRRTGRAGA